MTKRARWVLDDCKFALRALREDPRKEWRPLWVMTVALLRAVGHVLAARVEDPAMQAAIQAEWESLKQSKPKPKIFWEFIEQERNLVLKEYVSDAATNVTIHVGSGRPATYEYVMKDGPYAGQDARDVVAEAITWWEQYLDRIDQRAKRGGRKR